MKRSSSEMNIAILQALSRSNLMKVTHIMYKVNLNANVLKKKLIALESRGLIKSHPVNKENPKHPGRERIFYAVTPMGLDILHNYLSICNALGCVEL
jgi:predicted transcriptional regulator